MRGTGRSTLIQGLLLAAILGALALAASLTSGPTAALWCLGAGAVALVFFCIASYWRHRQVRRLTAEVDEVLHSGRSLRISEYREGDLAALRNELEKMVDRLTRLSSQLTAEKTALADALADISHQIRTPLTAAELMIPAIEGSADDAERKRLLRELETLLDRIAWLVATLLKIAKVDAGSFPMEQRPVAAAAVVNRALAPLAVALDIRGITLQRDTPTSVMFDGDELWCAEAVENIVKNCMESTPEGGCITIVAAEDALAVHLTVEDTGPGIAEADLPHLFERFYRGADSGHREGFGLGLALAQALISAQGGTLRAANSTGPDGSVRGARFEIALPKLCV